MTALWQSSRKHPRGRMKTTDTLKIHEAISEGPPTLDVGGHPAIVLDLFRSHANKVRRYLSWRLKNPEDAKDAAQEVFLRLWRQEREGSLREGAVGYMHAAASSVATDVERWRTLHRPEYLGDFEVEQVAAPASNPDDLQHWRDAMSTFVNGVKALPDMHRDLFVLHHVKGLTYPEIARELGISLRSAERYMSQALDELHETMKDYL